MPETRDFPLADILSITTGRLLSRDHMDGIYRILNYLTSDELFTHQLPRAAEACRPALIAQHPQLADAMPPDDMQVPALLAWLAAQERAHGQSLSVSPIAHWDSRHPLTELADMIGSHKEATDGAD